MAAQHPRGSSDEPERDWATVRWLGYDVAVSLCGQTLSPLVGITWWEPGSGAWAGSRVLDAEQLERLIATIEGLTGGEVAGDDLPPLDLGSLIDGVLEQ